MVLDFHSHVIPPSMITAIESDPKRFMARVKCDGAQRVVTHDQGYTYPLLAEFIDPEAKLAAMDEKGIDTTVVSSAPPMFYYWADSALGLEAARIVNDGIAEMVAYNPQRLRGMATIPMQDPESAMRELERSVNVHGFRAVEIGTTVEGVQLSHPQFRPFLRHAADLGVVVFAHPYYIGAKSGLEDYYLTNLIGNPLDTTIMIAHLIFSGVLDELPELKLCAAHAGGFAPYQIGRFLKGYQVRPEPNVNNASSPDTLLRRLYFDTITFNPQALRYLIDLVGADHIVLGTDAPFDMGDADPIRTVNSVPCITEQERAAIVVETASSLLGGSAPS